MDAIGYKGRMRRSPGSSTVALILLGSVALGLVTNVASSELPAPLLPYRGWSWVLLCLVTGAVIWLTLRSERMQDVRLSGNPRRTREVLARNQRAAWIGGLLDRSLYAEARIQLALDTDLSEPHPWGIDIAEAGSEPRPVPQGTDIVEIFRDDLREQMLIVGAPGSGKTTTMLEVLVALLDAAQDPGERLPLMINLSAWGNSNMSFSEWLAAEAASRYQVPAAQVQEWITGDELILLLDGLDEVADGARESCVAAINEFRAIHPTVAIAVCCREEQYGALETKLRLRGRVRIKPLTPGDVDAFLHKHGLRHAIAVLDSDTELRALVTSPLLLSVLMLAYRDAPDRPACDEEPMSRLFTQYIRRVLAQRTSSRFPSERLLIQLAFIAERLRRTHQTLFAFDAIDSTWRPGSGVNVSPGSLRAVGYTGVLGLLGWWWAGWLGLLLGVATGLAFLNPNDRKVNTVDLSAASRSSIRGSYLHRGVLEALRIGRVELRRDRALMFRKWAFRGVIKYSWFFSATTALVTLVHHGVFAALWCGAIAWAAVWLTAATVRGAWVQYAAPRASFREVPSRKARGARERGLIHALFGAVTTFAFGLTASVFNGFTSAVPFATLIGSTVFCYMMHCLGGRAVTEQRATRQRLAGAGLLAYPARPWLDHAGEALLLRRVGQDYLFVHLLIRDHLADLAPQGVPDRIRIARILDTKG
ncbi:NACHT domain-containing protein [Phytomonospora sp. NPDC050363]|uniref:NACHT domain-containing protein n=1 Tax=Phytomonospora sp. NPDC050363 TaxID=3155642 RepID=UPI0033F50234